MDEITVMATYTISREQLEHNMEVLRCTEEWAIRIMIEHDEPSTIRIMEYDSEYELGYNDGLDHCDCGVC